MKSIKLFLMLIGVLLGSNLIKADEICFSNESGQIIKIKGYFESTPQGATNFAATIQPGKQQCYFGVSIPSSLDTFDEKDNPIEVDKQTTNPAKNFTFYTFTKKITEKITEKNLSYYGV